MYFPHLEENYKAIGVCLNARLRWPPNRCFFHVPWREEHRLHRSFKENEFLIRLRQHTCLTFRVTQILHKTEMVQMTSLQNGDNLWFLNNAWIVRNYEHFEITCRGSLLSYFSLLSLSLCSLLFKYLSLVNHLLQFEKNSRVVTSFCGLLRSTRMSLFGCRKLLPN